MMLLMMDQKVTRHMQLPSTCDVPRMSSFNYEQLQDICNNLVHVYVPRMSSFNYELSYRHGQKYVKLSCVCAGEGKKWYVRCLGTLVCLFIVATPASASHSMEGGNKSKIMYLKCAKNCHFYAEIVKFGPILPRMKLFFVENWGQDFFPPNINAPMPRIVPSLAFSRPDV